MHIRLTVGRYAYPLSERTTPCMGDSLPRGDLPDDHPNNCNHPYEAVSERSVSAYVEQSTSNSDETGARELSRSATVMFCTRCETIVEVNSTGLDDLEYARVKNH